MHETRSDRGEAGFLIRGLFRIISNPVLSVAIIGIMLATLILVPWTGEAVLLASIFWPALVFVVLILALPSIGAMVRSFRLEEATRRNHALEHGTIFFLRRNYGKRYKLSGSSEARGFRIAGARSPADIEGAFRELMTELRSGNRKVVIARGCGSNIVTAQAIGLSLLVTLTVGFLFLSPSPLTVVGSVSCVVIVVALIRYPIGTAVQARRFLLLDFEDAAIQSISPLKRANIFERRPVYFVRTRVTLAPDTVSPPNRPLNRTVAKSAPAD
jgi:hypothetical protein